jgi:hypothetical protein
MLEMHCQLNCASSSAGCTQLSPSAILYLSPVPVPVILKNAPQKAQQASGNIRKFKKCLAGFQQYLIEVIIWSNTVSQTCSLSQPAATQS